MPFGQANQEAMCGSNQAECGPDAVTPLTELNGGLAVLSSGEQHRSSACYGAFGGMISMSVGALWQTK